MVILIGGAAVLTACGRTVSGPLQVQIPWPQGRGHYVPTVVTLNTVSDLQSMSGSVADTRVEPGLGDNDLVGAKFSGRFMRDANGFYVPLDQSLQAATVYAHLEHLNQLDQQLGIAQLGQWPRHVGLQARVTTGAARDRLNNAFYIGSANALILLPFVPVHTQPAPTPFSINAGVLAHEHFHSIFEFLVMRRGLMLVMGPQAIAPTESLPGPPRTSLNESTEMVNDYVIRGLNEGLADVWGWIYSGDPEFFSASDFDGRTRGRELDLRASNGFTSTTDVQLIVHHLKAVHDDSMDFAYQMGSQISRVLFQVYSAMHPEQLAHEDMQNGVQSRLEFARLILKALPDLGDLLKQNYHTQVLNMEALAKPMAAILPADPEICKVLTQASPNLAKVNNKCR